MPFTNDGPYASFNESNNFVTPSVIVPEGQTKNHIAIETSYDAAYYIELFTKTSSGHLSASAIYLVVISSSGTGLATVQKIGGSTTLTVLSASGIAPIKNTDTVINYFQSAAGITLESVVRITPIFGTVKVL